MCGITGFCDFTNRSVETDLQRMTDVLQHRGPDDQDIFLTAFPEATVGLGHRRLSILDLSALGHQPYRYKNITLSYNGEIYNFKEVRKKLQDKGHSFQSNSDTEVIVKAYEEYGIGCLQDFIGMFAFALLDADKGKLFLVRDRCGVKPLYYYWKNNLLLFSSEYKSFHEHPGFEKELDYDSLALYLTYSYIPCPYSIFKHAAKVQPGHYLEVDLKRKSLKENMYWNVVDYYNKPKLDISYEEAEAEMERLLISAFNYRMVADVPVGVFLSGGYDSSTVAALLQANRTERLKTFTIGFEDQKFDEAPYAKKVAQHLGTDHTEHYCTHKEGFDIIPKLPDIYDEPFGDNSIIPTTLVSQLAVQQVKVALSADGGDEIFAGYPKFSMALRYTRQLPVWFQSLLGGSMDLINPDILPLNDKSFNIRTRFRKMRLIWKQHDPVKAMKVISQFNTEEELRGRLIRPFEIRKTHFDMNGELNAETDDLTRMLAVDFKTFLLDNNLNKVDRATMSVSLEGREPLLDHRLVEFAAQLPSSYKFNKGTMKYILRNIIHKYVPREIMERPKMGFLVPIAGWFRNELKDLLEVYLDDRVLRKDEIFNAAEVRQLKGRYLDGKSENVQKIWHILVFQMWKERWKM